jgi:hypothetical protein
VIETKQTSIGQLTTLPSSTETHTLQKKQGDSFLKQVETKAPSGETVLKEDLGKEMSITKRTLLE